MYVCIYIDITRKKRLKSERCLIFIEEISWNFYRKEIRPDPRNNEFYYTISIDPIHAYRMSPYVSFLEAEIERLAGPILRVTIIKHGSHKRKTCETTNVRGFITRVVKQKSKPLIHGVGQLNAKLPLEGTGAPLMRSLWRLNAPNIACDPCLYQFSASHFRPVFTYIRTSTLSSAHAHTRTCIHV